MSRNFQIKTIKEGQQDIFNVEGDFFDTESNELRIYKATEGETVLLAVFQNWVYGIEKTPEG